jgi:hypothetical protein
MFAVMLMDLELLKATELRNVLAMQENLGTASI